MTISLRGRLAGAIAVFSLVGLLAFGEAEPPASAAPKLESLVPLCARLDRAAPSFLGGAAAAEAFAPLAVEDHRAQAERIRALREHLAPFVPARRD